MSGDDNDGAGSGVAARHWTGVDGERLRELRREQGLSQRALAGRAGLCIATVARLEREPRPSCRCRTAVRLAAALGAEPAAIMRGPGGG